VSSVISHAVIEQVKKAAWVLEETSVVMQLLFQIGHLSLKVGPYQFGQASVDQNQDCIEDVNGVANVVAGTVFTVPEISCIWDNRIPLREENDSSARAWCTVFPESGLCEA